VSVEPVSVVLTTHRPRDFSGLCSSTPNPWGSLRHRHYGHYSRAPRQFTHRTKQHPPIYPAHTYLHTSPMSKPATPVHVFETVRHPHGIGPTKPCIRVPACMPMDTSTHATLPQRAVVKSAPPSQPLHPAATVQCCCGQLVPISGIQQFRSIPLHHTLSSFISHFFSFPFPFPGQFFSRFAFA
jgi:hypothetical protein